MNSGSSVQLHIEELVLYGFGSGDAQGIARGVESELRRLVSLEPLTRHESVDRIDGGAFRVRSGAKPLRVGEQIAGAIHGGLNR
jgi:hypothetical protein